ncbi:MAG: hypothetical protein A2516_08450 [Alphaproteobacteria bacterium RIFOXYD12_FULL_60_8]|nr:MAG: hypothetical protein A2516_08450 [Alphaproteobacteria bacterium RIFOXYD12_FULL_60_8]
MAKEKGVTTIWGIQSSLGPGKVQRAVREVLAQIESRHPRDFERIKRRVKEIRPLFGRWRQEGTLGVWIADEGGIGNFDFTSLGVVGLALDLHDAVAVVAHEFGHVCTQEEDFAKREAAGSEWASELCADYYAYKWGFGRLIAQQRPRREFSHHGPTPGDDVTIEHSAGDKVLYRYRVTRSFMIHLVQTETPEGRVIETAAKIRERQRAHMSAPIIPSAG